MSNQPIFRTSLLLLLSVLASGPGLRAAELDITPLFAGYEHGCGIAGTAGEGLIVWTNPDDAGHLASIDALPAPWRNHVGNRSVEDRVDHWYVKLPFKDARFHGLRVSRLERWYGKSNGISGWAFVLETTIANARRAIDVRAFRPDESENFKPEFIVDEESKRTMLVCDFSM